MTDIIYNSTSAYPTNHHSKIRIAKLILNKTDIITYSDVSRMIDIIRHHIYNDNLSPKQIQLLYNIEYSDFGMFIKKSLGIKLKTSKEAVNNYYIMNNRNITDDKKIYWKNCEFDFDPFTEPNILGYDLLKKYPFSKSNLSPYETIQRDHMISKLYGWQNNIPAEHIRHPANCEIILSIDNITKNSDSSITYDELLQRINNWGNNIESKELKRTILKSPKSKEHRNNISKAITEWNKNRDSSILHDSLKVMEDLLQSKGIAEASKELGITKRQFRDNLRYRRGKFST